MWGFDPKEKLQYAESLDTSIQIKRPFLQLKLSVIY